MIAAKEPLSYLNERIVGAGGLGEQIIRDRLRTHLVPYNELAVGWGDALDGEGRGATIRADYERFLEARAHLMMGPVVDLCSGRTPGA